VLASYLALHSTYTRATSCRNRWVKQRGPLSAIVVSILFAVRRTSSMLASSKTYAGGGAVLHNSSKNCREGRIGKRGTLFFGHYSPCWIKKLALQ
jgi:hypothetical protein